MPIPESRLRGPRRLLDHHRQRVAAAVERRDFVIRGIYRHRDLELRDIARAAGLPRLRVWWIVRRVERVLSRDIGSVRV